MNEAQLMRQHTLFQKSFTGYTCNHGTSSKPAPTRPVTTHSYHRDTRSRLENGMTVTNYNGQKNLRNTNPNSQSSYVLPPLTKGRSSPAVVTPPRTLARKQGTRRIKPKPPRQVRPWREEVPPLSDNTNKHIELHYAKTMPKDKWMEYKPRQYVSNAKYGSIYEIRKDVTDSRDPVPPPSSWLWEDEYKLWRLDEKRPPPRSFSRRSLSRRKLGKLPVDKPHPELFAAYHSQKLDKQKRQLSAEIIQRHTRGWLVRKNIRDLKRQTLRGLGMSWPAFVKDYKETITRIQSRYGVMKTECRFDIHEVQEFIKTREKCERVYEKMVRYGKMEKSDLPEFFRQSGLHPTDEEISKAFNTIYRGSRNTAEIVFVLDCSASLGPINFRNQINFVKDVVRGFNIAPDRVRIGIVPDNSIQSFDLTQFKTKDEVLEAVDKLEFKNGISRTDLALTMMRQLFKYSRPGVKKIGLVCTDGKSSEPGLTIKEAKLARQENIELFAIGVGYTVQTHELEAMTGDKQHVKTCSNLSTINELKDIIKNRICIACCVLCYHILPRIEEEGLFQSEVLDILWTIFPPLATRLEGDINKLNTRPYYGEDQADSVTAGYNSTSTRANNFVITSGANPSLKDICRPLTRSEVMEIVMMVYPPDAAGLKKRKSKWIRPVVDGVEAWSLLDDKIIKKTDYKKCLSLVIQSKLERDGFMEIPNDLRLGVERVSNLEEALEKVDAYLQMQDKQKKEQEEAELLSETRKVSVDIPDSSTIEQRPGEIRMASKDSEPVNVDVQILKIDHVERSAKDLNTDVQILKINHLDDEITTKDILDYQHNVQAADLNHSIAHEAKEPKPEESPSIADTDERKVPIVKEINILVLNDASSSDYQEESDLGSNNDEILTGHYNHQNTDPNQQAQNQSGSLKGSPEARKTQTSVDLERGLTPTKHMNDSIRLEKNTFVDSNLERKNSTEIGSCPSEHQLEFNKTPDSEKTKSLNSHVPNTPVRNASPSVRNGSSSRSSPVANSSPKEGKKDPDHDSLRTSKAPSGNNSPEEKMDPGLALVEEKRGPSTVRNNLISREDSNVSISGKRDPESSKVMTKTSGKNSSTAGKVSISTEDLKQAPLMKRTGSVEEDSLELSKTAENDFSDLESLEDFVEIQTGTTDLNLNGLNDDVMDDDSLNGLNGVKTANIEENDRSLASALSEDSLDQTPSGSRNKGSQTDRETPVKRFNGDVSYIS